MLEQDLNINEAHTVLRENAFIMNDHGFELCCGSGSCTACCSVYYCCSKCQNSFICFECFLYFHTNLKIYFFFSVNNGINGGAEISLSLELIKAERMF